MKEWQLIESPEAWNKFVTEYRKFMLYTGPEPKQYPCVTTLKTTCTQMMLRNTNSHMKQERNLLIPLQTSLDLSLRRSFLQSCYKLMNNTFEILAK